MQELVEPYLDELISEEERISFDKHVARCARCRAELVVANRLKSEIRALPLLPCPDRVSKNVFKRTIALQTGTRLMGRRWLPLWLIDRRRLRPALAGGLVIVLAVSTVLVMKARTRSPQITAAEIADAETALKWTFAYVNQVGRRSGLAVRDEVFDAGIVTPVRRAVGTKDKENDTIQQPQNGGSL